jgi:hypothetical protein
VTRLLYFSRSGVEVAERYLGSKHAICITLKNSLVAAKKSAVAAAKKSSHNNSAKDDREKLRSGGGGMSPKRSVKSSNSNSNSPNKENYNDMKLPAI